MKIRLITAAIAASCLLILSGCGGGGSSTPAPIVLPPLPAGSLAIATDTSFAAIPPATGTITDERLQSLLTSTSTIGIAEADGTIPAYAVSTDQAPSPGSSMNATAVTATTYGRADTLAKVTLEIANCVKRTDGSYFMNGVITIIRPSTEPQIPNLAFQFTVTTESEFIQQFSYSAQTFSVSNGSLDSLLAFAYLSVTRPRS